MSGVFSEFRFWSPKLMPNPTPWVVLTTRGPKKVAVDFFESNAPNPLRLTQNSCLVCFRSFGFGHENSSETRHRGSFWPLVERENLQLIFFESNTSNPPHLIQNSCLVCFHSFGFGHQNSCKTRPRAPFWPLVERKKLQLIFRIERTKSTPFDPKLMSGVLSQFRFWSPKLVRNPTPRAVLAT